MKFIVHTLTASLYVLCASISAQEPELPQYEKPSVEFVKAAPNTIGVSYFACGAEAKSYEAMPSLENCQILKDNGGKFSETTDINKNGELETLRVGRFVDSDGGSGTFLEIIEDKQHTVLRSAEYQEFSYIGHLNGSVIWAWCYNCGNFSEILWRDGKFIDESPY